MAAFFRYYDFASEFLRAECVSRSKELAWKGSCT